MRNQIKNLLQIAIECLLIPYILYKALKGRFSVKKIDVGLGPQALINNIYHKKALILYGYSVETFVTQPFYITEDFDIIMSKKYDINQTLGRFRAFLNLIDLAFKYKMLYFYFYGGPLGVSTKFLWRLEAYFYKIAKVKTVIMPYGSDIQDMSLSPNLYFKHTLNIDYVEHKNRRKNTEERIDYWIKNATHSISGCEWVDYMYAWDTLTIAHFSIDICKFDKIKSTLKKDNKNSNTFKVFHAPNHQAIKGTAHLIKAVEALKEEGYTIELIMLTQVSNEKIIQTIKEVDVVADQFVIGWYAMFALEAMAMGKPVLCYLREDLIDLYTKAQLLEKDEIPILNTNILEIKENLLWAYNNREALKEVGEKSKTYVTKHHSLEAIGYTFDKINKKILK